MARTVRPDWVKPGQQWSAGQTFEDYKATGQPVNPSYSTTTQPPADQPTLESISAGIAGVAAQVPGIQAGIKELSATDLVDGAGTIDPVVGGTTVAGDGDTAISNTTGIQEMLDTMQTQHDKEVADLKKQQEDNRSFFTKMLDKKTSSKDILKEEYEAVEDSPAYKEVKRIKALIEPLNLQMADLSNKETAEIENARNLGMSEGWMDRKETELHNKYNRLKAPIATMLNAHAANALLYQGEVDEAYKYAYAAANAATYDQEFEYNTMKDFMDRNDDFLNSLQETDRFYFTNALDLAKDSLNIARDDANYVMDLQMQSGGQAGINPTDTRQQAQAKFARWSGQQPGDDKDFWTVIDKGKNELQQGESWGNVWNRVKAQFPNKSNAEIDNALGTSWREPGAYEKFKGDDTGGDDWDKARQFITDNPTGTYTELLNGIREYTGLSLTDSKSVLTEKGIKEVEEDTKMDKQEMIDWAKEQYKGDYSQDEIRASLLKKYPKEWVDEAIDRLEHTWFEKLTGWIPGVNKY